MMSLFFTLGSTVHDWGWPKNGPFWTKKGQTWQACQHSKVVQKGPKGTKMVNLNVFDHLGPILGPSGPFWTILDKNDFFAPNGQSRGWQRCFGAKYQFLLLRLAINILQEVIRRMQFFFLPNLYHRRKIMYYSLVSVLPGL